MLYPEDHEEGQSPTVLPLPFWAVLLIAALCWPAAAFSQTKPDILEIIEVSGEIGQGTAAAVKAQVSKINEQPRIKAVVLVMDSPGGGALASGALYEAIGELKAPVVAWCSYMCASGGLYAVMAPSVKYILVRPDSISGSVGVVAQIARYNRLLEWARIDIETHKSGSLKDAGNPTRAAVEDDRKYLQSIIDELAVKFYAVVAKARPNIKDWAQVKSARVFIGDSAVKIGLADAVGSREDAIKKAKDLSGSKLIFTREELQKVSKDANDTTMYRAPQVQPQMNQLGDVAWIIEQMKEMRQGETVTFAYKLQYRF
jgi:protease-4